MRRGFAQAEQHAFDLRREHVDAADDQHIVAATEHLAHPDQGASAVAGGGVEHRQVAGAVAQHRHAFFGQSGQHQLALFAVRQYLAADRIDDFGEEMVFIDVQAVLAGAFAGHAGADDLAEAVDVERLDAESLLDLLPHSLRPGFGAKYAGFEREVLRRQAHLLHRFGDIQRIGRGAGKQRGAEILH